MSQLTTPFQLVPDRKLTRTELVAAVRQALIAEHDAVVMYTLQAEASDDELVRKVLLDIANEERVHVGELSTLLSYLTEDEDKFLAAGREEVSKAARELMDE